MRRVDTVLSEMRAGGPKKKAICLLMLIKVKKGIDSRP